MTFGWVPRSRFTVTLEVTVLMLMAVVGCGIALAASSAAAHWEFGILQGLNRIHTAALDFVAEAINALFGPPIAVLILVIATGIVCVRTRSLRAATHFVSLAGVSWLGSGVIKQIVHRARPEVSLLPHQLVAIPRDYSFPSGHTAFIACMGMTIITVTVGWQWRRH